MLLMMWSSAVVYFISLVSNPITHQGNLTLLVDKRNVNVCKAIILNVVCLWLMQWVWLPIVLCIFLLLAIAWEPWISSHQIFWWVARTPFCAARHDRGFSLGCCIHHLRFGPSNHLTITSIRLSWIKVGCQYVTYFDIHLFNTRML